jgi:hypothetical protein
MNMLNFFRLKHLFWLFCATVNMVACASPVSRPFAFSNQHNVGDTYMGIRLWGTLELGSETINGLKLSELSGLAWDEDEQILYAVSDQGNLFHLRPIIQNHELKSIELLAAYPLRGAKDNRLKTKDSEDLAIADGNNGVHGDSKLLISFEGKPIIAWFTPQGEMSSTEILPPALTDGKNYVNSNKQLEAVALHPQLGILTAPELPLKTNEKDDKIVIYALNGLEWMLPRYPAPNSSVVALEPFDNSSVLLLERAFKSIFDPVIISLRQVSLSTCKCNDGLDSETKQIAVFDNSQGWRVDNFEGLTRHHDNYFFIVSDDNHRDLQSTLLSYFEVL